MGRKTRSNHGGGGRLWSLLWLLLLPPLAAHGLRRALTAATPTSAPVCGKPKVMSKIYGGQDVVAGQWPWQASLLYRNLHICGAVLIDARWLVTTAHCFVKRLAVSILAAVQCGAALRCLSKSHAPEDYLVMLGSTQLYQHTQHTRKMYVSRIITHPDFEKFHAFGNDIAMLQLHLPVKFTSYISPSCLPTAGMQLPIHQSCWITGWGMLSEDKHLLPPFHLQEGKVVLIENKLCNMLYEHRLDEGKTSPVHEEMLCAGDFLTGKAICRGDSGGPLVCDLLSSWVLVGLASWGLDCRHPIYPSVFTNVTYFADWINDIQRLTPLPDSTQFSYQPLKAASSPGPGRALMTPQAWLPLMFVLRVMWQALQRPTESFCSCCLPQAPDSTLKPFMPPLH